MIYDIGDTATVTTELRDAAGILTDSTVVVAVTKPDGTVLSPVPVVSANGGTGLFKATFTVTAVGTWVYKWTASGALAAVDGGQIEVVAIGRRLVASMDEFKKHLDRTDYQDDQELRLYLEAATNQIEYLVGPLSLVTVTERHCAPGRIALRRFPLVSVTTITPVDNGSLGTALTVADFVVDIVVNEIRLHYYNGGRPEFEVVYVVGRTAIPSDIKLAGLIIAQHLWSVQNARFTLNAPGEDQLVITPGAGFMVPYRALELLRPYLSNVSVSGIA